MSTSLRDAVPAELAVWLDAESTHEADCGQPGFPALRSAWIGRTPTTDDLLTELAAWLTTQQAHREAAEQAWQRLATIDPVRTDGESVPQWYTAWWAIILLSHPWDERLGEAVAAALAYDVPPVT